MNVKKSILVIISILATLKYTESVLRFEDEIYFSQSADLYNWENHPCRRSCRNSEPRTCYYLFIVEKYSSMSKACYNCPSNVTDCFRPHCITADGVRKNVYVVNRQLPGPPIEVCEGDKIVVDVSNEMLSESTAIHWHGINQKATPYSDGVPYVTQCPISPRQTFRYSFYTDVAGTYFWHSQMGNQRSDGLFGALIIRPKNENDVLSELYDIDEHYIVLTDWSQIDSDSNYLQMYHDRLATSLPTNILVNGLGRQIISIQNAIETITPNFVFNVEKNQKHRFRLINAGSADCPIEMSIDSHKMKIISLDGQDVNPVYVDALTIWPGERVDFVLIADQVVDNYWIRFRGLNRCKNQTDPSKGVFQVATLRYVGALSRFPRDPVGYSIPPFNRQTRMFNPNQDETESPKYRNINILQMDSIVPNDLSLSRKVDKTIYISFDSYPLDNYDFHRRYIYGFDQVPQDRRVGTYQFNHITLKMPSFPLLSQQSMIQPDTFCNLSTIYTDCSKEYCACTQVLEIELDSVVELVIVGEGRFNEESYQPLHLHGHSFRVIATKSLKGNVTINRVRQMDKHRRIKRKLNRAPLKDTVKVPNSGYTIIRFHANNPGYWFFHSQYEPNLLTGMALIFKVGEHREMPPVPYDFPTCKSYQPPEDLHTNNYISSQNNGIRYFEI